MAMDYGIVGVSHHTAGIELRERLNFTPEQMQRAYQIISAEPGAEAMVLSTCNRVELICHGFGERLDAFAERLLSEVTNVPPEAFRASLRRFRDADAVRHAMRVAGGLDSMVLGEPQILGQWKDAFAQANAAGSLGVYLQRLGQRTLQIAKRIRSETNVGKHAVNLSTVAVQLAEEIFDPLGEKNVLVLGAGEMAELAVAHFQSRGIRQLVICNRTALRAEELAKLYNASAKAWQTWQTELAKADVILVGAGGGRLFEANEIREAIRQYPPKPRLLIDLAVPRAVDPKVGRLNDLFLYSVDDLQQLARENLERRAAEAQAAERLIGDAVEHFRHWYEKQRLAPALSDFSVWLEQIRASEVQKTLAQARQRSPQELVEQASSAVVRRLLKQFARSANAATDQRPWAEVIAALTESESSEIEDHEAENRVS